MPSFTAQYTQPGVYVQYQDVAVPAVPAGALIPVVIGLGKKVVTVTESVIRGAGTTDILSHTSTVAFSSTATITNRQGTVFAYTADFTESSGVITWVSSNKPVVGSTYSVTYTYNKGAADYNTLLTSRIDDVIAIYGASQFQTVLATGVSAAVSAIGATTISTGLTLTSNQYAGCYVKITSGAGAGQERYIVSNTTGGVLTISAALTVALDSSTSVFQICDISTNTLSIGATLAVGQGAQYIMVVQAQDDISTCYQGSIDLLKQQECFAIAVMKGVNTSSSMWSTLGTGLNSHCVSQSSVLNRHFRCCVIGAPIGSSSSDITTAAVALSSDRAAMLSPGGAILTLNGVTQTVDGGYVAAAVLGILCDPNYTWGEPISGKQITVFDSIIDTFDTPTKNTMAANGVMVIETKSPGNIQIRHALSTDPTTIAKQEFKVIRIKDGLSKYSITNLERAYINTRNVGPEVQTNVKSFMKFLLDSVAARKDIVDYEKLNIVPSSFDSRQLNVSVEIKPTLDINWILLTFGVVV